MVLKRPLSANTITEWPWWKMLLLVILPTAAVSTALTVFLLPWTGFPISEAGPAASSIEQTAESRFLIEPYVSKTQVMGPLHWEQLGPSVQDDFLLGGKVQKTDWFFANAFENSAPLWDAQKVQGMMALASAGNPEVGGALCAYGAKCNKMFFEALQKFPVTGKTVLVIGSRDPWVEAICLANGAKHVTTVDFNPPKADFPGLSVMSLTGLDQTSERYEAVFSYSSLEHDGLGRYGDPINPWGDLERMKKIRGLVAENGLLYLGLPNGNDSLVFNAHRIYGPIRFPMLIEGWNHLATFGLSLEECYKLTSTPGGALPPQPLHVLALK